MILPSATYENLLCMIHALERYGTDVIIADGLESIIYLSPNFQLSTDQEDIRPTSKGNKLNDLGVEIMQVVAKHRWGKTESYGDRESKHFHLSILPLNSHTLVLARRKQDLSVEASFLALSNHEIRTPLMILNASLSMLEKDPVISKNDATMNNLLMLRSAGERLLRTFTNILDLAQLTGLNPQIQSTELDLVAVVREIIEESVPDRSSGPVITLRSSHPTTLVNGDRALLAKMVQHIIDNAIKFGAAQGKVTINLSADQKVGSVYLKVTNEGEGMPAETLKRAFETFSFGERIMEKHLEGMGVGLAIVKIILGWHNGNIAIDSAKDQGASVTIRLPLAYKTNRNFI